jgi:hypothetical protein
MIFLINIYETKDLPHSFTDDMEKAGCIPDLNYINDGSICKPVQITKKYVPWCTNIDIIEEIKTKMV